MFAGREGRSDQTKSTRFFESDTSSDFLGSRAFWMVSASAIRAIRHHASSQLVWKLLTSCDERRVNADACVALEVLFEIVVGVSSVSTRKIDFFPTLDKNSCQVGTSRGSLSWKATLMETRRIYLEDLVSSRSSSWLTTVTRLLNRTVPDDG